MKNAPKKKPATNVKVTNTAKEPVMVKYADEPRQKEYGSISLTEKDLAAIKDWKPGESYTFTVTTEMTELSKNDYYGDIADKDLLRGRFKITKVKESK